MTVGRDLMWVATNDVLAPHGVEDFRAFVELVEPRRRGRCCYAVAQSSPRTAYCTCTMATETMPASLQGESHEALLDAARRIKKGLEQLPLQDKAAYLEAYVGSPEVVQRETHPMFFLRVARGDADSAAARLAAYWKERRHAFGAHRFHRSLMDTTGAGALDEDDVACLATGMLVSLPEDKQRRPVLCHDISRVTDGKMQLRLSETTESRTRLLFYTLTKAAMENRNTQTAGMQIVRVVKSSKFNCESVKRNIAIVEMAMPVRYQFMHLCCLPPPEARKVFTEMVIPVVAESYGKFLRGRLKFHVASSPSELMGMLTEYDLTASGLPPSVGGQWQYVAAAIFDSSDRKPRAQPQPQKQPPKQLQKYPPKKQHIMRMAERMQVEEHGERPSQASVTSEDMKSMDGKPMDDEDPNDPDCAVRRERKRKHDLVYSRGRRQREKQEQDELKREHVELRQENAKMWKEHARLEALLAKANAIVARIESVPPAQPPSARPNSVAHAPRVDVALQALGILRRSSKVSVRDLLGNPKVNDYLTSMLERDRASTRGPVPSFGSILGQSQGMPGLSVGDALRDSMSTSVGDALRDSMSTSAPPNQSRNHLSEPLPRNLGDVGEALASREAFRESLATRDLRDSIATQEAFHEAMAKREAFRDSFANHDVLRESMASRDMGLSQGRDMGLSQGLGVEAALSQLAKPRDKSSLVNSLTESLAQNLREAERKSALLQQLRMREAAASMASAPTSDLLHAAATREAAQNALLGSRLEQLAPPQPQHQQNAIRKALISKIIEKLGRNQGHGRF